MKVSAAVAGAGATLALAACGQASIDSSKAEKQIKTALLSKVGANVASVSCPKGLKAKKGMTFNCQAKGGDGTMVPIPVTETDDKGNVRYKSPTLLRNRDIEPKIAADLTQKAGVPAKVDCPDVVLVKPGGTIGCKGTAGGKPIKLEINVDAAGMASYRAQSA